jgi:hypothetical protein
MATTVLLHQGGDIEMAIKDWEDDWRIPVLIEKYPQEEERRRR